MKKHADTSVDILMATYNGASFLDEQILSILGQTHADWRLFIRDDGSTDGTRAIIERYELAHPGRITVVQDDKGGLGAAGNFSRLMEISSAPYILFSDQDDIWEPFKVAYLLEAIRDMEDGIGRPLFAFSDLTMIDDSGNLIAPSLWDKEGIDPARTGLNQLLVQNVPYGCASMINRELLQLACPVDKRALLHDHWMVLLAAAAGRVRFIPASTIRHRIHDANASRSKNPIRLERQRSANAILANRNFNRYFSQLQNQALAVKERLLQRNYSDVAYDVLDDFINLRNKGLVARKYLMIKRKFYKHSRLQSIKWIIRI